jgi:hypothetical protein
MSTILRPFGRTGLMVSPVVEPEVVDVCDLRARAGNGAEPRIGDSAPRWARAFSVGCRRLIEAGGGCCAQGSRPGRLLRTGFEIG